MSVPPFGGIFAPLRRGAGIRAAGAGNNRGGTEGTEGHGSFITELISGN